MAEADAYRPSRCSLLLVMTRACLTGLIYCMEYLSQNLDWLKEKLEPLQKGTGLLKEVCHAALRPHGHTHVWEKN